MEFNSAFKGLNVTTNIENSATCETGLLLWIFNR